jgi:hypothetical protein
MELTKKEWILLLLRETPIDRIHIMKALFLIWHRSGRKIPDYFEFVPYLYGPCSFEVYSTLTDMESNRLIVQPPHLLPKWANYYLTEKGKTQAAEISKKVPFDILRVIKEVASEISKLSFYELLRKVYNEAPDFANNSMFKGMIKI